MKTLTPKQLYARRMKEAGGGYQRAQFLKELDKFPSAIRIRPLGIMVDDWPADPVVFNVAADYLRERAFPECVVLAVEALGEIDEYAIEPICLEGWSNWHWAKFHWMKRGTARWRSICGQVDIDENSGIVPRPTMNEWPVEKSYCYCQTCLKKYKETTR